MGTTNINLGLDLIVPTSGTKNWGSLLLVSAWNPISQHQHTGSGDGNLMVTASYTDNSVTTIKLAKDYGHTVAVANGTVVGGGSANVDIDWSNGNIQTLNTDTAPGSSINFNNLLNGLAGSSYKIIIINNSGIVLGQAGAVSSVIKWPQGVLPSFSNFTGAGTRIDIMDLYFDGTDYYGTVTNDLF